MWMANTRARWRQRPDGIPEIIRPPVAQLVVSEVVALCALCAAAAMVGAQLGRGLGVALPALVLAAYLRARLRRRAGRTIRLPGHGVIAQGRRGLKALGAPREAPRPA